VPCHPRREKLAHPYIMHGDPIGCLLSLYYKFRINHAFLLVAMYQAVAANSSRYYWHKFHYHQLDGKQSPVHFKLAIQTE